MAERDKSECPVFPPTSETKTNLMGKAALYLKSPVIVMHEHVQYYPDLIRPLQFLQTLSDTVCTGILLMCSHLLKCNGVQITEYED